MKKLSFKEPKVKTYSLDDSLFEYIENINGGFNEGELVTICTKFGQGQTSLAVQIAFSCATQEKKTLYVSTEEPESNIAKRIKDLEAEYKNIKVNTTYFFLEEDNFDYNSLEEDLKKSNAKFVIIDNLQGLVGTRTKHGAMLKRLATKYKCIIFVMSQVNRLKDPIMTDVASLSVNDTLLNDSDQIWITTNSQLEGTNESTFIIFNIVKNRKGMIGKTWLSFSKGIYYGVAEKYLKDQIDQDYIDYINDHYPRWSDKINDILSSIDSAASKVVNNMDDNRPIRVMKNGLII